MESKKSAAVGGAMLGILAVDPALAEDRSAEVPTEPIQVAQVYKSMADIKAATRQRIEVCKRETKELDGSKSDKLRFFKKCRKDARDQAAAERQELLNAQEKTLAMLDREFFRIKQGLLERGLDLRELPNEQNWELHHAETGELIAIIRRDSGETVIDYSPIRNRIAKAEAATAADKAAIEENKAAIAEMKADIRRMQQNINRIWDDIAHDRVTAG